MSLRPQDARPVLERQVRGDDGGAALVALREHLEQKLGARRRQRHVAEFVDDEELYRLKIALLLQKTALVAGFHELVNESRRRGERDGETLLAGGQSKSQGHMALAGAGIAEGDDVLPASWRGEKTVADAD